MNGFMLAARKHKRSQIMHVYFVVPLLMILIFNAISVRYTRKLNLNEHALLNRYRGRLLAASNVFILLYRCNLVSLKILSKKTHQHFILKFHFGTLAFIEFISNWNRIDPFSIQSLFTYSTSSYINNILFIIAVIIFFTYDWRNEFWNKKEQQNSS